MQDNILSLLETHFYSVAVLLIIAIAGLCWLMNYIAMRRLSRYLHKAKQEAREMAQICYLNPYPLIQISHDNRIVFANSAANTAFPDLGKKGMAHSALLGLKDHFEIEEPIMREIAIGTKIHHQTIAPVMRGDQRDLVIYCYDISQRKVYEESLRISEKRAENAQMEAERANKARGDFLANMSHELRTPMNGIIGLTDMLLESPMKEEQKTSLKAVNKSSRNLLALLNDLLDFSKIEAGELTIETMAFRPADLLQQIESLHGPVARSKGLHLITRYADHMPDFIMGDPSRLLQILNNLVSNAIKFTPHGEVTIEMDGEAQNDAGFIFSITVSDTGIGIPKNKQQSVFAKFQQADSSTARKYGGTGLGLAITKDLVAIMQGTINIQSAEGEGTAFTLSIPSKIADETDIAGSHEALCHQNFSLNLNAKIMIVDDHPVNLLYLRQVLTRAGFEGFDEATSGREAVELYKSRAYDLILMDCQMPDIDGYEASRQIRELENHYLTPPTIIAVTADAIKGAQAKCLGAQMNDYISKPIEKMKLLQILHKWIPGAAMTKLINLQNTAQIKQPDNDILPFDTARLHDFTGGKKDIEDQLIAMFLESLREDTAKMEIAFRNDNYSKWDEAVHKIYGAASNIGAYALAALCDEAQYLSEGDNTRILDCHKAILTRCAEITAILQQRTAA